MGVEPMTSGWLNPTFDPAGPPSLNSIVSQRRGLMPKGPQGQWRPADPMACAAHAMKVVTGEAEESNEPPADAATKDVARLAKAEQAWAGVSRPRSLRGKPARR